MTTLGRGSATAVVIAWLTAFASCPSTSSAFHPKLAHLAAIGSSVVIEDTGPSTCELLASSRTTRLSKVLVSREHGGFPGLPLLELTVTYEHEHAGIGVAAHLVRQGESGRAGQALAKRSANQIHDRGTLGPDRFK